MDGKRKPSKKQKDFAKEFAATGNGVQSALKVYATKDYSTAANIACDNLKKPNVIKEIKSIADKIPNELLEQVHLEGLKATQNDVPDYSVRHKYLDSAYKLKKLYEPERVIVGVLIVPEERKKELNDILFNE